MIFEQLSLEYYLADKPLPWNKHANPDKTPAILTEGELDTLRISARSNRLGTPVPHMVLTEGGEVFMIKADLSKAKSRYFDLKR